MDNYGNISFGANTNNTITYTITQNQNIDWDRLASEIKLLQESSNAPIRAFANDATEIIKQKDTEKVKSWLSEWMPIVGGLIKTSHYILKISGLF